MFREGVSDRDITYAFSFELERRMGAWHRIEIREPRGGDENYFHVLFSD